LRFSKINLIGEFIKELSSLTVECSPINRECESFCAFLLGVLDVAGLLVENVHSFLVHQVSELVVQFASVRLSMLLLVVLSISFVRNLDLHFFLIKHFLVKLVKRDVRDSGVLVSTLVGQVCNQSREVLLKLRQVQRNVVLVESGLVVVLHLTAYLSCKLSLCELFN